MTAPRLVYWFSVVALVLVPVVALAQPEPTNLDEIETQLDEIAREVDTFEGVLEGDARDTINVDETRSDLAALGNRVLALGQRLTPLREAATASLRALGPAPAEEAPEEPEEIAKQRAEAERRVARAEGLGRRIEVLNAQILLLDSRVAALSRARFVDRVFDRGPWPWSPTVWSEAAQGLKRGLTRLRMAARTWLAAQERAGQREIAPFLLGLGVLFVLILAYPARLFVSARLGRMMAQRPNDKVWLFGSALLRFINRLAWISAGLAILFAVADFENLITPETRPVALAICQALLVTYIGQGLSKAVFSPHNAAIRPLPVTDAQARALATVLNVHLVLVALDLIIRSSSDVLDAGLNLAVAQTFIVAMIMAFVNLPLTRRSLWAQKVEKTAPTADKSAVRDGEDEFSVFPRWGARIFVVNILLAAVLGYAALARFIVEKTAYLVALSLLFYLVRGFCQAVASRIVARYLEERAETRTDTDEEPESFIGFWVALAIDAALIIALTPAVLVIVGLAWEDIRTAALQFFAGITLGPITLSPGDLLTAVVLFGTGLVVIRLAQRLLDRRILPKTHLNYGVRNSLTTLLGYIGTAGVLLLAIGATGVDLSNLAIIAGALSVGIGFGLQSVVNNFVSGLILLFERPIKVGDWIVTSSGEGIVKRISVRSTEIESFDRQSIIVPNAELISSTVSNWSHRDKIARVIIPVGVSYSSDPRLVEKLLLEVAAENRNLTAWPKAFVYFAGFGDSSLDFELRAYVRDNDNALSTKSNLRFAIFEKLREAGVEIPFPQRDLHLRSTVAGPSAPPVRDDPEGPPPKPDAPEDGEGNGGS